jgi:hypothetical protein
MPQTIVFNDMYIAKLYSKYDKLRIYKHILKKEYIMNPNNYILYQIMLLKKQTDCLNRQFLKSMREYKKKNQDQIFY